MEDKGGRPLIFDSPEDLQSAVDSYFKFQNETGNPRPTLSGLAHHIGIDRQTLYNYKKRDVFFDIVKKATDFIESIYEERLIYENNPTGVIFALKNMGWKDKQEIDQKTEHSGEIDHKITGMEVK